MSAEISIMTPEEWTAYFEWGAEETTLEDFEIEEGCFDGVESND